MYRLEGGVIYLVQTLNLVNKYITFIRFKHFRCSVDCTYEVEGIYFNSHFAPYRK